MYHRYESSSNTTLHLCSRFSQTTAIHPSLRCGFLKSRRPFERPLSFQSSQSSMTGSQKVQTSSELKYSGWPQRYSQTQPLYFGVLLGTQRMSQPFCQARFYPLSTSRKEMKIYQLLHLCILTTTRHEPNARTYKILPPRPPQPMGIPRHKQWIHYCMRYESTASQPTTRGETRPPISLRSGDTSNPPRHGKGCASNAMEYSIRILLWPMALIIKHRRSSVAVRRLVVMLQGEEPIPYLFNIRY